jgi:micrococcal nuclease
MNFQIKSSLQTLNRKLKTSVLRSLTLIFSLSLILQTQIASADFKVAKVHDGDTIKLGNGKSVRFLQIDTPELGKECYAAEAKQVLVEMISGSKVTLKRDPGLPNLDSKGTRLARYVFVGEENLNLELVRLGAAAPWLYKKQIGIYAEELVAAGKEAYEKKIGLWGACPDAKFDEYNALSSGDLIRPSDSPSSSSSKTDLASPGAFCPQSDKGQQKLGKNGKLYTCKVSESENRLRWRS